MWAGCTIAHPHPPPVPSFPTLMVHWAPMIRLGLLRSRWMILHLCRWSMPSAAPSASRSRLVQSSSDAWLGYSRARFSVSKRDPASVQAAKTKRLCCIE